MLLSNLGLNNPSYPPTRCHSCNLPSGPCLRLRVRVQGVDGLLGFLTSARPGDGACMQELGLFVANEIELAKEARDGVDSRNLKDYFYSTVGIGLAKP